jgi:hypothetical protein
MNLRRIAGFIDDASSPLIRWAYLAWAVTAASAFFSDRGNPLVAMLNTATGAVAPLLVAFAMEAHSYLSARRVMAANRAMEHAEPKSQEYRRARRQRRVNLWILAGLAAFSILAQYEYLSATWTPPATMIPGWVAIIVRAAVTPLAFIALAVMLPMETPAEKDNSLQAQLARQRHSLLLLASKKSNRQWRARINRLYREGKDITPIMLALTSDEQDLEMMQAIHAAITAVPMGRGMKQRNTLGVFQAVSRLFQSGTPEKQIEPPRETPAPVSGPARETPTSQPQKRAKVVPLKHEETLEQRLERAHAEHPEAGSRALARYAGVPPTTAWRWLQEHSGTRNAR